MENGLIRISEKQETTLVAHGARLHLVVQGTNFVFGNAALERCAEVKHLVEQLQAAGIPAADFAVKSVVMEVESGLLSKASKGVYNIAVTVNDTALLGQCLGAVAAQKHCKLQTLEWLFDDDDAKIELARSAMAKAKRKADAMLEAVGYRVGGIRSCSDSYEVPVQNVHLNFESSQNDMLDALKPKSEFAGRAARYAPADIGTELRGEKTITAIVSVDFIIQPAPP